MPFDRIYRPPTGGGGAGGDCPPTGTVSDNLDLDDHLVVALPRDDQVQLRDSLGAVAGAVTDQVALTDSMVGTVGPLARTFDDQHVLGESLLSVGMVDVAPTMDAWTDGDNPAVNHGSDDLLQVSSGLFAVQAERWAYLAWDFTSPTAFTAVSGDDALTLTMYFQTPLIETPFEMRADGLIQASQPWVENAINANNAPAHPDTGVASYSFPALAGSGDRTVTLDGVTVGDVLGNWLSLRIQMSGLVEVGVFNIRSREHATVATRPRMDWAMEKVL